MQPACDFTRRQASASSAEENASQYPVAKLIERYGREAKLVDWKDAITADCPRRANARVVVTDQCGAHFPNLLRLQI